MTLKLPFGVSNDELDWNTPSVFAKKFNAEQCLKQNEMWSNCQKRMERLDKEFTTLCHPNGNWQVVLNFETVGEIAYEWLILSENN